MQLQRKESDEHTSMSNDLELLYKRYSEGVLQKDLELLIDVCPQGVELVISYDLHSDSYFVSILILGSRNGEKIPMFTQRGSRKTFKDISRALSWGESQGFTAVSFYHKWKK